LHLNQACRCSAIGAASNHLQEPFTLGSQKTSRETFKGMKATMSLGGEFYEGSEQKRHG
jgi:hypothetical protein